MPIVKSYSDMRTEQQGGELPAQRLTLSAAEGAQQELGDVGDPHDLDGGVGGDTGDGGQGDVDRGQRLGGGHGIVQLLLVAAVVEGEVEEVLGAHLQQQGRCSKEQVSLLTECEGKR